MKSADEWYQEGLAALELSRGADYHSEYVSDLESAVAAFEHALTVDPQHVGASGALGIALARLGRHSEAEAALGDALALAPKDAELKLVRAQSLQQMGNLVRALSAYDEVLQARPGDSEALYGRAEVLESLRWDEDALDAWEAVLDLPDNRTLNISGQRFEVLTTDFRTIRAFLSRACALARLRRDQEAIQEFTEILTSAWTAVHGPLLNDRFVNTLRELDTARIAYRNYVERKRNEPRTWRLAGETWRRAGFIDEALSACSESVKLSPRDGDAWWGMGEALAKAGRLEEAVEALRHALTLNPVASLGIALRLKVMEQELASQRAVKWKLIGRDTFAREDYLVGEFDTAEAAESRLLEKEASVTKTQDESLRDEFWIVPPASNS